MGKVRRLDERLRAAERDSGALRASRARVDKLTADRALLTSGTERAMAERASWPPVFANWGLLQRHTTESWAFWGGPCGR